MSIQIIGANSGVAADIDSDRNVLAYRRLMGFNVGSYSLAVASGNLGATLANDIFFSMWWTDPVRLALIESVEVSAFVTATITTSVKMEFSLYTCHRQVLADSGGTVLADVNVNSSTGLANQTRRSTMAQSAVTDMRIASSSSVVNTNVTGRDFQAIGRRAIGMTGTVLGTQFLSPSQQYLWHGKFMQGAYPLVLEPFTKLSINAASTAGPATGTWAIVVRINWSEIQLSPPQL